MISTNKTINTAVLAMLTSLLASCADSEIEYTGILEHRPQGKDGMWVIDGRSFSVTDTVELDEDAGALVVDTCVGLEMRDGEVTEIETMDADDCQPAT